MNRRSLIAACPTVLLFGCGPKTKTDLDLIALGVQAFAPVLIRLDPAQAKTITDAAAVVVAADKALAGVVTPSSSGVTVSQFVTGLQVLAPIALAYLPAGSVELDAANAAMALLPGILAAAGLAGAGSASGEGMTPSQARAVLLRLG